MVLLAKNSVNRSCSHVELPSCQGMKSLGPPICSEEVIITINNSNCKRK